MIGRAGAQAGVVAAAIVATFALAACSRDASRTEAAGAAPRPTLASRPPSIEPGPSNAAAPIDAAPSQPSPPPVGPVSSAYLGRKLASPMSFEGADWLERTDRETTERPEHVLDVIGFSETDVVADVGAGSGYFTVRIAKRVPRGRVIATDLQKEMLAMITTKVAKLGLGNVETRLVTAEDARLPAGGVDVVLFVDVYHELPRPALTLAQVKASLRAASGDAGRSGRLVLVEYRGEDPSVPIKPDHKMTLAQIRRELDASGFSVERVDESLPHQRIVIAVAR